MKKRIISIVLAFVLFVGLLPLQTFAKKAQKPLEGKYISVIGDSISTYQGWSDSFPITAEDCTCRYGEAYYGKQGSDCHNTDLLVTDTWWHQAAEELGATPLMINSGNSSGLLRASYPNNADWQQYLQDMLAYKTRPYYLGRDGKTPDVIALYIGSADVAKSPISEFGSVDDIDFDALIRENADGTFAYAEPVTVAEAYCIMLHKIQTTYPAAEIYCFTVVPNAGGKLDTCNKRLRSVLPFNEMVKGVAAYHGAAVVDLFAEFGLDPDGDAVATEEDWEAFRSCYHNDPHPNAAGFDVITRCFVNAVKQNSRHFVQVETTPGRYEPVAVKKTVETIDGVVVEKQTAENFLTGDKWRVDYSSVLDEKFIENYTVRNMGRLLMAEGGSSRETVTVEAAGIEVNIPLTQTDDPNTTEEENRSDVVGDSTVIPGITGDPRTSDRDGTYDYTEIVIQTHPQMLIRTTEASVTEATGGTKYTDMTGVNNDTAADGTNDMITGVGPVTVPANPDVTEGYDLVFLGADKFSNFFSAFLYNSPADDQTDSVYSDSEISLSTGGVATKVFKDRNLLVPKLYLKHTTVSDGTKYPALWSTVQQFTLADRYGNPVTGYCVDNQTDTVKGHSYRIENLEDAEHYTPEEAGKIRAIVNNGYWGTAEGYGSLQAVRDMMTASGKFSADEVAMLTDGMAMTATQLAIWSFSNRADDIAIVNCYYSNKVSFYRSDKQYEADGEKTDLIFKLVQHLTELPSAGAESGTDSSLVINEKNYLKNISAKIIGKAPAEQNNLDVDPANDVYLTDISFALTADARLIRGDLVMTLYNANQEPIAAGRIAGTPQEGEVLLIPDGNGRYTFAGIPISEGEETTLRFALSGTQDLGRTPYLLISERKTVEGEENVPSQPLVCVADGHQPVDVEMTLTFCAEVSDEVYSVERHWRKERSTPPVTPPAEPPVSAKTGCAVLTKVDGCDESTTLANVVFSLYRENGRLVGIFTTDEDGMITVQDLPAGNYYWIELRPAEGYRLDPAAHEFTVSAGCTAQITVTNTRSAIPDVFGDDHYAYIIGYDDGLVHPERNISRGEVATVFFRLLDEATRQRYLTEKNSFTDVHKGMWFNTAISTMEAMGIVNGYDDGTFRPNDSITRAEFAAIAARFDANGNPYGRPFADIFSHWAEDEICTAYNNGWILGYEDGTFKPDQYIVRSEAMTLINRVLQRIPENLKDLLDGMVIWPDNMDTGKWYYLAVQEATNSHDYDRKLSGYEHWTVLREVRDWTVYEK